MIDKMRIYLANFNLEQSIEEATLMTKDIMLICQDIGLYPIYNLASSKAGITKFDNSTKKIEEEIINSWDKKFPKLGTHISKFYSISDDFDSYKTSGRIFIGYSNCSREFAGNFTEIDIYKDFDFARDRDSLIKAFKDLVILRNPSYSYIESTMNYEVTGTKPDDRPRSLMPRTVQWVNYWENAIVEKIGIKNIRNSGFYSIEKMENGYILFLQEYPINNENEIEIKNQLEVIEKISEFWK